MKKYPVVLCLVALLICAQAVLGAEATAPQMTQEEMRAKCAEIDAKCAEAAKLIENLQALRASLTQQMGEGAPPPEVAKSSWAERVAIGGYFQGRFEHLQVSDGPPTNNPDQFGLRRMYVTVLAKPNPRTQGVITWSRDGGTSNAVTGWAQAYVDYSLGRSDKVRMGQAATWFGLETWQSSSARLPFERSAFVEGTGRGKPWGMFYYGPYDRGVWWIHTPQGDPWMPQVVVGAVNGAARIDRKFDDQITASVDLKWKPSWGMAGISWLDGETSIDYKGDALTDPFPPIAGRNALDAYIRYEQPQCFAVQAEGMTGTVLGHDVRGWCAQLEKPFRSTPGTAFVRYDQYDSGQMTSKAPFTEVGLYEAWTLGYAHQLDPNNRITLEMVTGAKWGSKDLNSSGVQWQMGF
ncbi:MAG: hypothetical protein GX100_01715 [candidate division WS1 bacterium]|nr:hypothetical protein [candidate division WS1 bacterium]